MQLTLALFNPPNQPPEVSTPDHASAAWDDIDETSRLTALAVLARLIARMLAAEQSATRMASTIRGFSTIDSCSV